jgi:DNA-binding transcriptional LysR family regulator
LSGTPFDPARSTRVFRVLGDNILAVILLPALMAQLADEAPGVHFQLSPVSPRAVADQFADGSIDLAFLPEFTPETLPDWVERVPLFTDVAVAIAGSNNERLAREGVRPGATIPMALFCEMRHALFAPRGATEGEEDKALAAAGRTRKVVATVPDFFSVARLVAETDLIGTVPIAFALPLAERLGFATYRLPFAMPPAYLDLYWHRRHADDPEHRWMREKIIALLTPLANSLPLELAGASAASRRRQTPIKRPIR